jgi:UDP-2,3-diacylglucosamine pyrophosphatase LpxH
MLVFISDLHFIDGTAGSHNIKPKAFDYFFQDLMSIIRDKSNAIQEVEMVFLGDVFDLLRTCEWFGYPLAERPWGEKAQEEALRRHAETIFDGITDNDDNKASLKKIEDNLAAMRQEFPKLPVETFYIPGNHDRLVNQFPSIREKVCNKLKLPYDHKNEFQHVLRFPDYGVVARHGHEYDFYNYEGGPSFNAQDYRQVPIGDPITTELVSRLPFEIARRLEAITISQPEKDAIIRNFQEIDNVRPFGAVIEWLLYQVKDKPQWLIDLIEETVDDIIRDFSALPFVQAWFERHDKWLDPFDKADQVQIALYILDKFKVFSLEKLFSLVSKVKDLNFQDPLMVAAPDERDLQESPFRYVIYGHTHEPLMMPIRIRAQREQIYLNTGTWRTRYQKSVRDNSFIGWKNMTYLIFYRDNERPGRQAEFESWTGSLKTL